FAFLFPPPLPLLFFSSLPLSSSTTSSVSSLPPSSNATNVPVGNKTTVNGITTNINNNTDTNIGTANVVKKDITAPVFRNLLNHFHALFALRAAFFAILNVFFVIPSFSSSSFTPCSLSFKSGYGTPPKLSSKGFPPNPSSKGFLTPSSPNGLRFVLSPKGLLFPPVPDGLPPVLDFCFGDPFLFLLFDSIFFFLRFLFLLFFLLCFFFSSLFFFLFSSHSFLLTFLPFLNIRLSPSHPSRYLLYLFFVIKYLPLLRKTHFTPPRLTLPYTLVLTIFLL